MDKILIRKIRLGWMADHAPCPVTMGCAIRPTHGLALAWALSHIKAHNGLECIEKKDIYR